MLLAASTFAAGVCVNGAVMSMAALAASFYPTSGRATGVSWMTGMGRFGGMLGPVAGGLMLKFNLDVSTVFTLLAIPLLIQAVALWLKRSVADPSAAVEFRRTSCEPPHAQTCVDCITCLARGSATIPGTGRIPRAGHTGKKDVEMPSKIAPHEGATAGALYRSAFKAFASREALVGDGIRLSYEELASRCKRMVA